MLALCRDTTNEEELRRRLLDYLGTSVFSEVIERILEDGDNAGIDMVIEKLT